MANFGNYGRGRFDKIVVKDLKVTDDVEITDDLAITGLMTVGETLTVTGASTFTGAVSVDDTTDTTSGTTGSIHTDGGLGVAKDVYVGDDLFIATGGVINFHAGNLTLTHASGSLSIAGSTAGTTLNITSAAPTAANNGIYSLMTSSASWTGSLAAIRGRNTVTATGAGGNCYGGWFNLLFSSGAPTGLGLSAGLYVEAGSNIATTGVSSVLMATLLGDADGAITTSPILTLADASTLKTKYLMEVGFNAGATTVGTDSGKIYYNETLHIMVNGGERYIPLSTAEGTYTTAYPIITTRVNPDVAYNGIYTTVTEANTFAGSIAGIRSTVTCSATAAIGNVYGGRFELIQSAVPASQGHTCGLYVQVTPGGGANNPTSVLTLCRAGDSTGTNTPFINFLDANSNKTTYLFEIGTGNAVGTGTSGTALFETSASIGNVDEITAGLRVKVNGVDYYLLMATPADIQD